MIFCVEVLFVEEFIIFKYFVIYNYLLWNFVLKKNVWILIFELNVFFGSLLIIYDVLLNVL